MGVRNRVRHIRKQRGLSALELAERAGLTKQGLNRIERCAVAPNTETAIRLAAALDTDLCSLVWIESAEKEAQRAG